MNDHIEVSLRLPDEAIVELEAIAALAGVDRNVVVNVALAQYVRGLQLAAEAPAAETQPKTQTIVLRKALVKVKSGYDVWESSRDLSLWNNFVMWLTDTSEVQIPMEGE